MGVQYEKPEIVSTSQSLPMCVAAAPFGVQALACSDTLKGGHPTRGNRSASRAGLLTGCYPNRIGIHGALGPRSKVGLSTNEMTLAELVRQRGYTTGMFGKWHLGDSLTKRVGSGIRPPGRVTEVQP
jgi:hypothetical protein